MNKKSFKIERALPWATAISVAFVMSSAVTVWGEDALPGSGLFPPITLPGALPPPPAAAPAPRLAPLIPPGPPQPIAPVAPPKEVSNGPHSKKTIKNDSALKIANGALAASKGALQAASKAVRISSPPPSGITKTTPQVKLPVEQPTAFGTAYGKYLYDKSKEPGAANPTGSALDIALLMGSVMQGAIQFPSKLPRMGYNNCRALSPDKYRKKNPDGSGYLPLPGGLDDSLVLSQVGKTYSTYAACCGQQLDDLGNVIWDVDPESLPAYQNRKKVQFGKNAKASPATGCAEGHFEKVPAPSDSGCLLEFSDPVSKVLRKTQGVLWVCVKGDRPSVALAADGATKTAASISDATTVTTKPAEYDSCDYVMAEDLSSHGNTSSPAPQPDGLNESQVASFFHQKTISGDTNQTGCSADPAICLSYVKCGRKVGLGGEPGHQPKETIDSYLFAACKRNLDKSCPAPTDCVKHMLSMTSPDSAPSPTTPAATGVIATPAN